MSAQASDDVHDLVDQQLRRTRQRYTTGRRQLVDVLVVAGRPVTLGEIRAKGADQSQSSLYRNLAVLEHAGAVHRVVSSDDTTRFELAEELSEHHHHVVCTECGRLDDIVLPASIERALGEAAREAFTQKSFTVDSHHLEFVGVCSSCR